MSTRAGRQPVNETPTFERFPYPRRLVVGLLPDKDAGERASERLRSAGFESDRFTVLHGADDARTLDVTGEQHGLRGEVQLESGAQAVLLTACGSPATRRSADGRRPVDTGT